MKKENRKHLPAENLSPFQLAELHKLCSPGESYSEQSMRDFLNNDKYLIFSNKSSLAITHMFQEIAEIITLAVNPLHRKSGLGSKLLKEIIKIAKTRNCTKIFLEVSSQNFVAIRLYKNAGFKTIYVRKNYYTFANKTLSDAFVMALKISN